MTLQKFHNDRQFRKLSAEKNPIKAKYVRTEEHSGQKIYKGDDGEYYIEVIDAHNNPSFYTMTEEGEPDYPVPNIIKEESRKDPFKKLLESKKGPTKSASEAYRQNKTSTVIDALKGKKSTIQKQESIVPELKTIASTNYSDQYKGKDDRFVRAYHHVKYVLDQLIKKAVGAPPSETKPSKFEFETKKIRPTKDWKPDEYSVATGKIEEVISNAQGCVEKMEIIDESVKVYKDSIKEIKKAVNAKEKELRATGKYTEVQEEVTRLAEELGSLTTGNAEAKEQAIRWNDRMLRIQTKIKEMPSAPSPQQKLDFVMGKLEALGSEGKKVKKALYDYERDNTTITKQIVTSIQSIAISKVFEKELEGLPVTESIKVAGFMDVVNKVKGFVGSIWNSLKTFTSSLSSANAVADEILEGLE